MSQTPKFTYKGKNVDVEWDSRLCIHIGECSQASGDLFISGREPWCVPDQTSLDDVVEVVERCPSGALSYTDKSGIVQQHAKPENHLVVSYNGPYFLTGQLDIEDAADDMQSVKFRAALCRCGYSKNKPFCDNQHEKTNFKDYGAVANKGPGIKSKGGILNVKTIKDGPLVLSGNITIFAASGRLAWQGNSATLCRCGASKDKPFCDGSHNRIEFKSD